MTDAALLELQALRAEVRDLAALVQRLLPRQDPRHAELVDALLEIYSGMPFTACEAVDAARLARSSRRRLSAALDSLGANDSQRLGMVLASVAKTDTRLQRLGTEGGRRLWAVDSEGLGSA
jgi:hypothetical protein